MDRIFQDLRFAGRLLWKDRGFSATTIATLAVCIAANTAIFALVHAILLRPLPFSEPERIATLFNSYPAAGAVRGSNGVPDYYDRLAQVGAFEEIAMYRVSGVTIGGAGAAVERVSAMPVTPSFFRLLRAQPHRGRLFTDNDAEVGHEKKVVLSHGLWQRLFGGRDAALGSDLRINGTPHEIVGVMPAGFRFVDPDVQLWTPVAFTAEQRSDDQRHSNSWQQVGRLRPGATIEQAQSQLDALNAANLERFPQLKQVLQDAGFTTVTRPFLEDSVETTRPTLYLLWGGVLCVLLIGCVNIANLVSVRTTARLRELATRHALGASLERLSRQILTETLLIAVCGGGLGVLLGWWALGATQVLGFDQLPRGDEVALDWTAVLFTLALVLVVGVLVALIPVVALRHADLAQIVREEGRSGTPSRRARMTRRALVTSQVAFALVLLVGAGLLVASFERVLGVDPGFEPARVMTGSLSFPASRYKDEATTRSALDRFLDRVRAIPGVQAAGVTSTLPLSGQHSDSVIIAEGYQMQPGESLISPSQVWVSPGYFDAMATEIKRGRGFDGRDVRGAQRVIIVDERLAQKFWPGQDPVGRRMYFPGNSQDFLQPPPVEEWLTVVGVVENVRLDGLVDGAGFRTVGAYYLPLAQGFQRTLTLAVRTATEPTAVTSAIRAELAAIDPELPFYGVRTMDERVALSLIDRRTPMILAGGFAVVALFLAAIGVYGVLAYQVSQRRREIGIRMALGAATTSIFRMVLQEGAAIVALGAALGLGGAFLLRRTFESQLFEVRATDPTVIAMVGALLMVVAIVACVLPARRAAATEVVTALNE
jgi:predicted permease